MVTERELDDFLREVNTMKCIAGTFSTKHFLQYYKEAIDFSRYAKLFSITIFTIWIIISIAFFIIIYNTLAIAELSIISMSMIFQSDTIIMFNKIATASIVFYLFPLMSVSTSEIIARLILLIYIFPVFWFILRIIGKRVKAWKRNLRDFQKYRLESSEDEFNLNNISLRLSIWRCSANKSLTPKAKTR
jgi:hypothetical protein